MKKLLVLLGLLTLLTTNVYASGVIFKEKVIPCSDLDQSIENNYGFPAEYNPKTITLNNLYLSEIDLQPKNKIVKVLLRGKCDSSYAQWQASYKLWEKNSVANPAPVAAFSDTQTVLNSTNHIRTDYNNYKLGSINGKAANTPDWIIYVTLSLDQQEYNDFKNAVDTWGKLPLAASYPDVVIYKK